MQYIFTYVNFKMIQKIIKNPVTENWKIHLMMKNTEKRLETSKHSFVVLLTSANVPLQSG